MDYNPSRNIPSNQEIIDDLTKDLEKSFVQEEKITKDEKSFVDTCIENDKNDKTNEKHKSDTNSDEINENKDEEEDEYFIDDIALKDRDLTITEEEKQKLKNESDNYKVEGNNFFRDGHYKNATSSYTQGLRTCPLEFEKDRAILYANRAASKAKFMSNKNSAIMDCTKAIELDSTYIKVYLRRAHLYKEIERLDEALADYKTVLTFDPTHKETIYAIQVLEPIINERNEKLKKEMMGKLKDLGNMVLRPFGLSTNNFQMQKDEASGGYSVKFVQNPT